MAVGSVATADSTPAEAPVHKEDFCAVKEALGLGVRPEDLDEHRMHAVALSIHIECMRPALGGALLATLLDGGTPPDARHEAGRTALMLAANNGRVDLCSLLLDAGANAASTDGSGITPLICACLDLGLAKEREDAGLRCDPPGVVALLLQHGALVSTTARDGTTALAHCRRHGELECAQACVRMLEEHLPAR